MMKAVRVKKNGNALIGVTALMGNKIGNAMMKMNAELMKTSLQRRKTALLRTKNLNQRLKQNSEALMWRKD